MTTDAFMKLLRALLSFGIGYASAKGYLTPTDANAITQFCIEVGPILIPAGLALWANWNQKSVPQASIAVTADNVHPASNVVGNVVNVGTAKIVGALLVGVLVLGSFQPAHAQLRKLTGNPAKDFAAPTSPAAKQKNLTDILADIAAKGTADLQAADDVAAAIDPDTGKMQDMIAHACFPALIKFIGGLPKGPADGSAPGPAVIFERARLTRRLVQAGLPDYLKMGCAPLVQDEANFFIKILTLAGVAIGTGGLGALAIPAVPGLLSALPIVP